MSTSARGRAWDVFARNAYADPDAVTGGWDIHACWSGVVICATPRFGELDRSITIP